MGERRSLFLYVVTTAAGAAALSAIFCAVVLFNDISNFQSEIRQDLEKFKLYADDAWTEMVTVSHARPRRGYAVPEAGKEDHEAGVGAKEPAGEGATTSFEGTSAGGGRGGAGGQCNCGKYRNPPPL